MVLSKADKREIAAMFEAFSFRMGGAGQQSRPVERMVMDTLTGEVFPIVKETAEAFSYRMGPGRQVVPFPEQAVGAAIETAHLSARRR